MLDTVDRHLLTLLSQDSRMPMKELAKAVGLSAPSTSERMRRLQEKGVLNRFSIVLDPNCLGYSVQLLAYLRPLPGLLPRLKSTLINLPALVLCEQSTGAYPLLARMLLHDLDDIETTLAPLRELAEIRTEIITQTLVAQRCASSLLSDR